MGLRDFCENDRTPALILAQMQELASSRIMLTRKSPTVIRCWRNCWNRRASVFLVGPLQNIGRQWGFLMLMCVRSNKTGRSPPVVINI